MNPRITTILSEYTREVDEAQNDLQEEGARGMVAFVLKRNAAFVNAATDINQLINDTINNVKTRETIDKDHERI